MLMIILSVLFSSLSVCTMSYLAMTTQMGPWVAPIFVVVCMTFAIFLVNRLWFHEHAVVTIVAGSMGGVIGLCVGLSFPLFYFLQRAWFVYLLSQPILFFSVVVTFVLTACVYAMFFAYFLRSYFLSKSKALFPISQLVYDMLIVNSGKKSHWFMLIGLGIASLWDGISLFIPASFVLFATTIHMAPMLFSVGFIAGNFIILPTIIGLCIRLFVLDGVKELISNNTIHSTALLTAFSFGMILVAVCRFIWFSFKKKRYGLAIGTFKPVFHMPAKKAFGLLILFFVVISKIFSFYCGCSLMIPGLVLILVAWLLKYVVEIYSELGVIDVSSFAWFIVLPIVYFFHVPSLVFITIFSFSVLCFGLVVDCFFSYKLAELANLSFSKILKYQIIGSLSAAVAVAIFLYCFATSAHFVNISILIDRIPEMSAMASFTEYDLVIFLAGFLCGWCVVLLTSDLLIVIAVILTSPLVAAILSVAAITSDFTSKPKRWYPLWFGVYAGHMFWLIVRSLK